MVSIEEADDGPAAGASTNGIDNSSHGRLELLREADEHFVDRRLEQALDCYTRANAADSHPSVDALSRRAEVHIRMESFEDAVADADKALKANPNHSLSYLRKGIACFNLDEYEAALDAFESGQKLNPGDPQFKQWIRKAEAELQDDSIPPQANGSPASEASTPSTQPKSHAAVAPSPPSVKAAAAASAAPLASGPPPDNASTPPPRYRHEWYQTPTHVVVSVFAKGLKQDQVSVAFGEQVLSVVIKDDKPEPFNFFTRLFGKVDSAASQFKILGSKVEVKLAKAEAIHWTGLEAAARAKQAVPQPINISTDGGNVKTIYPSSSKQKVDWDKIEQEVKKEEKDEKLDGDAALNKFFQQIYGDADEETRRAMNKSFVESSGTVLSTNWKEVGTKKIERKE